MKHWLDGSCHCGGVRFRVRVPEGVLDVLDCNCSICKKKGFLHLIVEKADFELVQGADLLTTYTFGTGVAEHTFCRVCGVHPFYTPRSHPDGIDVNARCLEGETRFRVEPFDGQNWEQSVDAIR